MRSKKPNSNTTGPSTYHNDNVALELRCQDFPGLDSPQKRRDPRGNVAPDLRREVRPWRAQRDETRHFVRPRRREVSDGAFKEALILGGSLVSLLVDRSKAFSGREHGEV